MTKMGDDSLNLTESCRIGLLDYLVLGNDIVRWYPFNNPISIIIKCIKLKGQRNA